MDEQTPQRKCPARKWTKAAGWAAFLFFLIKGIAWLAVPAIVAYYATNN